MRVPKSLLECGFLRQRPPKGKLGNEAVNDVGKLEATAGIEPAYPVLQTGA
jgi:hypothetical protein